MTLIRGKTGLTVLFNNFTDLKNNRPVSDDTRILPSASATLQVYALDSALEQLCCPLVNISHLFGKAVS